MKREDCLPLWFQSLLPLIREACERHHIKYLYVAGSLLRPDDFGPASDIDWIFDFERDNISDSDFLDNLDAFWGKLEQITGRHADLIHYPSLHNPYFIADLDATKVLIYDLQSEQVSV